MIKRMNGPFVIGGIGGSGTRLIARVLKEFNTHMGFDLNSELDNLTFTLLFKHKNWLSKNLNQRNKIFKGLTILEKTMTSRSPKFSFSELLFIYYSTFLMFKNGHNHKRDGKGDWAIKRLKNIRNRYSIDLNSIEKWGWKEPNAHLILPFIDEYFPDLRYIHVIRNGLDIAYSSNQQQLFNWAHLFSIKTPSKIEEIPVSSLQYWISANKSAINYGIKMGSNRFHLLNFDKFASYDKLEIEKFLNFIGIENNEKNISLVNGLIKTPVTIGRYKNKRIDWLTQNDVLELKNMGFKI